MLPAYSFLTSSQVQRFVGTRGSKQAELLDAVQVEAEAARSE